MGNPETYTHLSNLGSNPYITTKKTMIFSSRSYRFFPEMKIIGFLVGIGGIFITSQQLFGLG